jgi:aryl-alcohol dehydrogenase-like predicted oxidoreductase
MNTAFELLPATNQGVPISRSFLVRCVLCKRQPSPCSVKDLIAQEGASFWALRTWPSNSPPGTCGPTPDGYQNQYPMMARDPEAQILPICKELKIGFVGWSPHALTFLTGAIDQNTQFQRGDFRAMVPWLASENRYANIEFAEGLPGIRGPLAFSPATTKPLCDLVEVLL